MAEFKDMNEKMLRDRIRYLSDKMEIIWNGISPQLKEFDLLKSEFDQILKELDNRGLFDEQIPTRKNIGENIW